MPDFPQNASPPKPLPPPAQPSPPPPTEADETASQSADPPPAPHRSQPSSDQAQAFLDRIQQHFPALPSAYLRGPRPGRSCSAPRSRVSSKHPVLRALSQPASSVPPPSGSKRREYAAEAPLAPPPPAWPESSSPAYAAGCE